MNFSLFKITFFTAFLLLVSNMVFAMSAVPATPYIDPSPAALNCGTEAAKAACLTPKQSAQYYIEQSIKYFRTMESSVSVFVQPNYSSDVVRWEWAPWLLLTGYGETNLIWTDILLKLYPTAYSSIDCRAFDTQPFGRCHVVFDYGGHPCPIYEEFTFNDQGEMTFIEAWSDYPSLLPMDVSDHWAQEADVKRLATKVPGLGNPKGYFDPYAGFMKAAGNADANVKNLLERAKRPYSSYVLEFVTHLNDLIAGCEPPQ